MRKREEESFNGSLSSSLSLVSLLPSSQILKFRLCPLNQGFLHLPQAQPTPFPSPLSTRASSLFTSRSLLANTHTHTIKLSLSPFIALNCPFLSPIGFKPKLLQASLVAKAPPHTLYHSVCERKEENFIFKLGVEGHPTSSGASSILFPKVL